MDELAKRILYRKQLESQENKPAVPYNPCVGMSSEEMSRFVMHLMEQLDAIKGEIQKKDGSLVGNMASEGTTPRRLTDLIGSLCDLTSGSGDKGTPIVLVQGYFDNYTTE